jgi:hypothetical protein
MNRYLPILACLPLVLTACEDSKKALGFQKSVPDEYQVISHPPLSLPPEYNLRPPVAGAARPQELPATERAQKAVLGTTEDSNQPRSFGEKILLENAGVDRVDPDIREELGGSAKENADPSFWEKLKSGTLLVDKPKAGGGETLDPLMEKKRLLNVLENTEEKETKSAPKEAEQTKEKKPETSEKAPAEAKDGDVTVEENAEGK